MNRDLRRTGVLWGLMLLLSTLLYAGGQSEGAGTAKPTSGEPIRGGTVTLVSNLDWDGMDPHYTMSGGEATKLMFEPLVRWAQGSDGTWKPVPVLATSWELKGREAIFKLRKNVKFHDGSDFNAEVAAWNIQRAKLPDSKRKEFVDFVESVQAIDAETLKIVMKRQTPVVLINLSDAVSRPVGMVSKQAVDKWGKDFARHPSGTGPFKFQEWITNDRLVVVANKEYWDTGKPYIDKIVYRVVPDEPVRIMEAAAKSVDYVTGSGLALSRLRGRDFMEVKAVPWQGTMTALAINQKAKVWGTNQKLRQAACYAIDRDAIARTMFPDGEGVMGKYFIPVGQVGYAESVPFYNHDPDKAKKLLAEAGYPNGIDVVLTIISREADLAQAEMIKSMWEKVGIRAKIDVLERTAYLAKTAAGDFEIGTVQTSIEMDPDGKLSPRFETGGHNNVANYSNPKVDELLRLARVEYDQAKRHQLYVDFQKVAFEDAMWSRLIDRVMLLAYNKRIQNLDHDFLGHVWWQNVWLSDGK